MGVILAKNEGSDTTIEVGRRCWDSKWVSLVRGLSSTLGCLKAGYASDSLGTERPCVDVSKYGYIYDRSSFFFPCGRPTSSTTFYFSKSFVHTVKFYDPSVYPDPSNILAEVSCQAKDLKKSIRRSICCCSRFPISFVDILLAFNLAQSPHFLIWWDNSKLLTSDQLTKLLNGARSESILCSTRNSIYSNRLWIENICRVFQQGGVDSNAFRSNDGVYFPTASETLLDRSCFHICEIQCILSGHSAFPTFLREVQRPAMLKENLKDKACGKRIMDLIADL